MIKYHLVTIGSTPDQFLNEQNKKRYRDFPTANEEFINSSLNRVSDLEIAYIYHGDQPGTDSFVEEYAYVNHIRTKQFPAYWRKRNNDETYNKGALFQAHENMINAALSNAYPHENHEVVLLVFSANPDDALLKAAVDYAGRKNKEGKNKTITVRVLPLPVPSEAAAATTQSTFPL